MKKENIKQIKKTQEQFTDVVDGFAPNFEYVGYNKLAVDSANFHIEQISPSESMQQLEDRLFRILPICLDPELRDEWLRENRIFVRSQFEKQKEKLEEEKTK